MARPGAIINALKSVPGGARYTPAPQSSGAGRISPVQAEMYYNNSYANAYGPFLERPSRVFTDGAFAPMSPIQPTPVDQPPPGGTYPGPRYWQYRTAWNLPTPPGSEGLKLACYDATTEILTRRGWLTFPELNDDDEVATRNPGTKVLEWQQPTARHAFDYDGELVHFKSRGIDLLVTPNHRVLHTSGHSKNCSELVKRADECEILRSGAMIATSIWSQPDLEYWDVPAHENHGYVRADITALRDARKNLGWTREQLAGKIGINARIILNTELGAGRFHVATLPRIKAICAALNISSEEIIKPDALSRISGDDFAAFMGAYLSEGCVSPSSSGNLRIFISQKSYSKGYEEFRSLLVRILGREPYYDGSSWTFAHDGLALFLRQFGHSAPEKRIPGEVLDLSARQLRVFWDFYLLGDGWTGKTGQAITTTSRILAGQLQEVAQKIGLSATVHCREARAGGMIGGRQISGSRARYDVFLRTTKSPKWTSAERMDYEGTVYCVSVPNGIVYVRRNGKAIWSGNSFDQLRTLAQKYSVARAAIELRQAEIRGLRWDITLTTDAAKAYQGDTAAMRDFGERKAKAMRFFKRPDPDFWSFSSFLNAFLEEIFVYDALSLIFRPKYGASFGMGGRGLMGSNLDSLRLISGPTIRPLIDIHGGKPAAPAPAYQQFLYGVPRSDYMTIATGADIEEYGLAGSEVNEFNADVMLYAPYWDNRETPYGFPPVERALLPIISGLQKQEFQLDYFTEGTVPAVYISPGDTNITPTQIGELQNALNALAGDPAYHLKVVVLPPGSKVEPQRPVDLSDSFDYLVMNQTCMAFDVQPQELGIIPDVGANAQGPSSSGIRFSGQESRDIKSRKSTMPLLMWICDIFNYVIQDICDQPDMQFQFESLVDDEDKQAITSLGVEQVQNGISSIDEIRERLDLPPWGLKETSEPIVMTQQGPVPFSMAPQLLQAMMTQDSGSASAGSKKKTTSSQPSVKPKAGTSATKPNGSHPAPVSPSRPSITPQHATAAGALQKPVRGQTGGTPSRSPVAGSRKRGEGLSPTQGRARNKTAATSELDALKRHIRKGRSITSWEPRHITDRILGMIAEDTAKGVLLDTAVERALDIGVMTPAEDIYKSEVYDDEGYMNCFPSIKAEQQFPGWQSDLGLIGKYTEEISQAFQDAEIKGSEVRKRAGRGEIYVSNNTLHGIISDATREIFLDVMTPMWTKAWDLGYDSAQELTGKSAGDRDGQLRGFLDTEGTHWLDQVSRTGLGNSSARSEVIARTETARAMNAGALQHYSDAGVSYKHLLVSPDDTCDICMTAKEEGEIPLDAIFPGGNPPFHPACRCVAAPAGFEAEPPMSRTGKSLLSDLAQSVAGYRMVMQDHPYSRSDFSGAGNCECGRTEGEHPSGEEDDTRVCWLLIRARDENDKWRYLLQQRDDGTWGMPGGKPHAGEDSYAAALRETVEEIGHTPPLKMAGNFSHMDPDGKAAYLYLMETEMFIPTLDGSTPWETNGVGWFRRKEIRELDLTPKFRDDWEKEVNLEHNLKLVGKSLQNMMTETGEWIVAEDTAAGMGAHEGAVWPNAGPGAVPGASAGGEPPRSDPDRADTAGARLYPRGSDDDKYPRRRGRTRPASRFPDRDPGMGGKYPSGGNSDPGIGAVSVGDPSREKEAGEALGKSPQPVAGSVPAKTPKPYAPHPVTPETPDLAGDIQQWDPGKESNTVNSSKGSGGPGDYSDPNETDPEHILNIMRSNFPEKAIGWVSRARWIGPVKVPWERIDDSSEDSWAASHQPGAVNRYARDITTNNGKAKPSILVQRPGKDSAFIVDGHHRALAHKKLNQPVTAYVGMIQGRDVQAAEETHSSQFHSGSDPRNN